LELAILHRGSSAFTGYSALLVFEQCSQGPANRVVSRLRSEAICTPLASHVLVSLLIASQAIAVLCGRRRQTASRQSKVRYVGSLLLVSA